jgi:hypothetical protein
MNSKEYSPNEEKLNILQEDGDDFFWKAAEEKKVINAINTSYTDRFKIMMRLMRINKMLSCAKVTHKKIE